MDDVFETEDYAQGPDLWPLAVGETLSNHDWFPLYGHRLLGSSFVMRATMAGRHDVIGAAVILWAEAMRQDPAGTLPDDDLQLASLARFRSVEEWQERRADVLRGFVPVAVEDGRNGRTITRLGHPVLEEICFDMLKRKKTRDASRANGQAAVRRSRLKKKMLEVGAPEHMVADDRVVGELLRHFEMSDLYMTPDNVRQAMRDLFGYGVAGGVVPMRPAGGHG
ncbi:MAG: hypothetical protein HWE26_13760 [Alteromonadaceae bacterium]|nr:hypothetical protein [Alteromonadaceae bacterium]